MNVLIQFPTRWRVEQFLDVLEKYFGLLSGKHEVRVQVVADNDDADMAAFEVEQAVRAITHGNYWFRWDSNRNKIEAVNRHMEPVIDGWKWDVCILASDDMIPQRRGYEDAICQQMQKHFPDTDGVLWFNDGYAGKKLNTLSIFGRKYFERWGYIYYPKLASFFGDDDWQGRAAFLGRQVYIDDIVIKHEHPFNVGGEYDALYKRNDTTWKADEEAFNAHRARRYDIPILDILVCTLPVRHHLWARLRQKLESQILAANATSNVRIVTVEDDGKLSIGTKRNMLLDKARAEYTCFLDDDDNVSNTYVPDILAAIGRCAVDTVGLKGRVMSGPGAWQWFIHSTEYTTYTMMGDGTYVRPPNHLNPMRRAIATKYRFLEIDHGEDTEWALRIAKGRDIRTQQLVERPLYYYIPSGVSARYAVTAWDAEVTRVIDRSSARPQKPPPKAADTLSVEPGTVVGEPPAAAGTADQNIPGKFPAVGTQADPTRNGIGGWRWEGPEWLRKKKLRAMQRR